MGGGGIREGGQKIVRLQILLVCFLLSQNLSYLCKCIAEFEMMRNLGDVDDRKEVKNTELEQNTLSKHISFDAEYVLLPETIKMCNHIVLTLNEDDPGLVVQVENLNRLHNALGLIGSPVPPGVNVEQSLYDFRNWLQASASNVVGVGPAKFFGPSGWHHLTERQANQIVYNQWQVIPWVASIQNANYPGPVAAVFWLSGTGPGRCDAFKAAQVFG